MRSKRWSLAVILAAMVAGPASAQLYPGPFMNMGWGGWGSGGRDPGADYLRGVGYFNRAQADYDVKEAQASELRAEAFAKWNQALGEARKAKEIRDTQQRARDEVENAIQNRAALVEAGVLLNQRLDHLVEFPTPETHDALAAIPMTPEVLRDIPFENASEPITACLDILTQEDAWPPLLKQTPFDQGRQALASAVDSALGEDLSGALSDATRSKLDGALNALRSALDAEESGFPPAGANDADQFLRTLGGMIRLLEDPQAGAVIRQIESFKGGSMADLVGFMHAYNLRFGRARSDQQRAIYRQLDGLLAKVPVAREAADSDATGPLVEHSKLVGDAAKQVFSSLSWKDLDAASADGP
ncbi:hypothetical protein [Tautonia plasticadhaerens]|uniref:Uncharacterized protein n=1 Tax=Tautonia plasticadhaerens TaxID=2527974 RepID=A0A518GVC0_9BACT|nr:hypothetical protein [Tautonia plasticadhaerens]QDV32536.1 hypothetical protein ElP_03700 [Tautonia plasticadhaerens]